MIKLDLKFRLMLLILKLRDIVAPVDKRIDTFCIKEGNTVIDYGCGVGSYITRISKIVGSKGKVYAVDIHQLAIKEVKAKINKYKLNNVEPVIVKKKTSADVLNSDIADVILAMDMIHMVPDIDLFLQDLHRLIKKDGFLLIEPEHMSFKVIQKIISNSGKWRIDSTFDNFYKCVPLN